MIQGNEDDISTLKTDVRNLKDATPEIANEMPTAGPLPVPTEESDFSEQDHSFHFTPSSATVGDISDALLYYQGVKQTIDESSTVITGTGPWEITIGASHTHFYLEVDVGPTTPTFTLKSGTSFPDAASETRIYPILEFTEDDDTGSCIEHQQSDIHLDIPPQATDDSDFYKVLSVNTYNEIVWDYPRYNAG
jgi:hypothetical protein